MYQLSSKRNIRRTLLVLCGFITGLVLNEVASFLFDKETVLVATTLKSRDNHFLMVILILSSPQNFERRKTIRETWLTLRPRIINEKEYQEMIFIPKVKKNSFLLSERVQHQKEHIINYKKYLNSSRFREELNPEDFDVKLKHFFVMGSFGLNSSVMMKIAEEQTTHDDLLILDDLKDNYNNLTKKILKSMKKLEDKNLSYKYLFKCDDDTYSKLDLMSEALNQYDIKLEDMKQKGETMKNLQLYWGYFDGGAPVRRAGKFEDKEYNLCGRYFPYAIGGGYVISRGLVIFITKYVDTLSQYKSEDASVGTWLSSMRNIHRWHDVRFDTWYTSRECRSHHFVRHKRTLMDMEKMFEGNFCFSENLHKKLPEYFYNWKSMPSRCCRQLFF